MRAVTAINRLLGFVGTAVQSLEWFDTQLLVRLQLRSKILVCPCGATSRAQYDKSRRRWRHVNFGQWQIVLEADIRRVDCRRCGQVRSEWVSWARPGSRMTRDFEDMVSWLAARMSKTAVAAFMGTAWRTVDAIVKRRVDEHLDTDRLDKLYRIGVDEIAYKKGRKFLTVVADHDTGRLVWAGEGRSQAVLGEFFDLLDPQHREQITAVSMDMGRVYREGVRAHLPHATICFDPFHVIKWAGETVNNAYLAANPNAATLGVEGLTPSQAWRRVRHSLRVGREKLDLTGQAIIEQIRKKHPRLHKVWQFKEDLRDLYTIDPDSAALYLHRWIKRALRTGINGLVLLARRIRRNLDGIIAAVHLGLSNSLVEGINSGIRLIQRRAHGYANLDNLLNMIYLCHGGIPLRTPTGTS